MAQDSCLCCSADFVAFEERFGCSKCGNTVCGKCLRDVSGSASEPSSESASDIRASAEDVSICKDCEFMGKWVNDVKSKDKGGKFWNIKMPKRILSGMRSRRGAMPKALNHKFSVVSGMLDKSRMGMGTGGSTASQRNMTMQMPAEMEQDLKNLSREKLKEIHDQKKRIVELQAENARMRSGSGGGGGGGGVGGEQLGQMKTMIDELKRESEAHIAALQLRVENLSEDNAALRCGQVPPPRAAAQAPAAQAAQAAQAPEDPKWAKYRKMQKAGLPEGAVAQAASRDGLTLPADFFTAPTSTLVQAQAAQAPEDPKWAKYRKMQKAGLPEGAVTQAASRDGLTLPADFFTAPTSTLVQAQAAQAPEDPKWAKYRKMQKAGLPEGAVAQAASRDGLTLPADFFTAVCPLSSSTSTSSSSSSSSSGPPPPPPLPGAGVGSSRALVAPASASASAPKSKYETTRRSELRRASDRKDKDLRGIFWNVLAAPRVEKSMWARLPDSAPFASMEAHLQALEKHFGKQAGKKLSLGGGASKGAKAPSSERPPILDAKRQQNLGIAIARFKEPVGVLKQHILEVNRDFFTMEVVHKLISMAPTPEEVQAVKAAEGAWSGGGAAGFTAGLTRVEHFVHEMAQIPRLRQRLQAIFVEMSFERQSEALQDNLERYLAACRQLRDSKGWQQLLHLVLTAGNYLNSGNKSTGGAWGFEVSTGLQKLAQAKASGNPRFSLLHWVAQVCDAKCPDLLELPQHLGAVADGAALRLEDLKADLAQLSKGCALVQRELEACSESTGDAGAKQFVALMRPFLQQHGLPVTEQIKSSMASLDKVATALLEMHGEVPAKCSATQLLTTAMLFCKSLARARDDNVAARIADAEKAKKAKGKNKAGVGRGVDLAPRLAATTKELDKKLKADKLNKKLKTSFKKAHTRQQSPQEFQQALAKLKPASAASTTA